MVLIEGIPMDQSDILQRLYELQTESNERDARIETQLNYMDKRMNNQEELLSKMSDTLNEQKHLSSIVDSLALSVASNTKRIDILERANAEAALSLWKKIGGIALSIIVTGAVGYVLGKLGFSVK